MDSHTRVFLWEGKEGVRQGRQGKYMEKTASGYVYGGKSVRVCIWGRASGYVYIGGRVSWECIWREECQAMYMERRASGYVYRGKSVRVCI